MNTTHIYTHTSIMLSYSHLHCSYYKRHKLFRSQIDAISTNFDNTTVRRVPLEGWMTMWAYGLVYTMGFLWITWVLENKLGKAETFVTKTHCSKTWSVFKRLLILWSLFKSQMYILLDIISKNAGLIFAA